MPPKTTVSPIGESAPIPHPYRSERGRLLRRYSISAQKSEPAHLTGSSLGTLIRDLPAERYLIGGKVVAPGEDGARDQPIDQAPDQSDDAPQRTDFVSQLA